MSMKQKVYLNFPITMIPPIYNDDDVKQAMENIIRYGIVAYCIGKRVGFKDALAEMNITAGMGYEARKRTRARQNQAYSPALTLKEHLNSVMPKRTTRIIGTRLYPYAESLPCVVSWGQRITQSASGDLSYQEWPDLRKAWKKIGIPLLSRS